MKLINYYFVFFFYISSLNLPSATFELLVKLSPFNNGSAAIIGNQYYDKLTKQWFGVGLSLVI